jgi:hypothetical protein
MQMPTQLREILRAISVMLMVLHVMAAAPAGAHQTGCREVQVSTSETHQEKLPPGACCTNLHCCPVIQDVSTPGAPLAIRYLPEMRLQTDVALVLDKSIDPPPRTLSL